MTSLLAFVLLLQAFQSFDPDYSGRMRLSDFRRILDNFCFPLSDAQFKHLQSRLVVFSDQQVEYTNFVGQFKDPDTVRSPSY